MGRILAAMMHVISRQKSARIRLGPLPAFPYVFRVARRRQKICV
jgi:hypothetical protein